MYFTMQEQEKKLPVKPEETKKMGEKLNLDDLESVSAGGAFSDIPRVPTNPIDDDLKGKV